MSFLRFLILCLAIVAILASQPVETRYAYDALNRLVSVTYPDGTEITYTYDAVGNRTQKVILP